MSLRQRVQEIADEAAADIPEDNGNDIAHLIAQRLQEVLDDTALGEEHTTIPHYYRARLVRQQRIRPEVGKVRRERMHLHGEVHPVDYNMHAATELVLQRLEEFLASGWHVESLVVNDCNAKTA